MESNFEENLLVQIKLNNNDKLLIGIIYRSPSKRSIEHNSKLRELLVETSNLTICSFSKIQFSFGLDNISNSDFNMLIHFM